MGCTQSMQTMPSRQEKSQKGENFKVSNTKKIKSQQKLGILPSEWQQFSQQNEQFFNYKKSAIIILSKEELSSSDFQFLLQNQIWKVQWFESVSAMLQIDQNQAKTYESQIMKLFLKVKIKQAKFLQNENQYSVLCDQCYRNQLSKLSINSEFINRKLFQTCKICQGLGWVQQKLNHKARNELQNCSICDKTVQQCKTETECSNCLTFGFKWKAQ